MTDGSTARQAQHPTAPQTSSDADRSAAVSQPRPRTRRRFLPAGSIVLGGLVIASLTTAFLAGQKSPGGSNWSGQSSMLSIGGTGPQSPAAAHSGRPDEADETAQAAVTDAVTDEEYRRLLLGKWKQNHLGERELVVSEDGTAVMTVLIHGGWAYVLGDKLEVDIAWKIEDGQLDFRTTGGRPKEKMKVLTKLWGSHRMFQISELTEDRLHLLDEAGEMDEPWERADE